MKTCYKNDLKRAYLILEANQGEKDDYQIVMLQETNIAGLLRTEVRYVDNQSHYYYDISGKTSFKTLHEKMHLKYEEMKNLVEDLLRTIRIVQKYMLDGTHILLEPEYIFCEKERFYFCYYPPCEQDAKEEFHKLTEFFVREVDYKDEEGVHFAYTLHKATMEENYSIEEIMEQLLPEEDEEEPVVDYVEQLEHFDVEDNIIEEKFDMWESVRRLLDRGRRRKEGYPEEDL